MRVLIGPVLRICMQGTMVSSFGAAVWSVGCVFGKGSTHARSRWQEEARVRAADESFVHAGHCSMACCV